MLIKTIKNNSIFVLFAIMILGIIVLLALPGGISLGVVLLGGVNGALYALTALGLVLIYRSQKIINFAQAQMGALAVAVAVVMVELNHMNYFLALLIGLVVAIVTGAIVHLIVQWRFKESSRMILTVATLGIAQVIGAMEVGFPYLFSRQPAIAISSFSTPFNFKFKVSGILFTGDYVVAVLAAAVCLVGLWIFLEKTRWGMAFRAYADSRDRTRLLGIKVSRISLLTWTVAAGLSAVAAMAAAPASMGNPPDVTAIAGPTILLAPLAAAVVGRMDKLFTTVAAAILLGIFQEAIFWSYPRSSAVDLGFLVIIFISLLIQPPSVEREAATSGSFIDVRTVRAIPSKLLELKEVKIFRTCIFFVVVVLAVIVPPIMGQSFSLPAAYAVIYAIMTVSLVLLSGWAGQISLGQSGFAGVGAAIVGMFLAHSHVDLFVALVISAVVGAVVAVLIGLPALRIPGLFLSVITLAFAIVVDDYFLNGTDFPFWNPDFVPATRVFGKFTTSNSVVLYEVSLGVLAVLLILIFNLSKSRIKRTLIGIRDNEYSAAAFGISRYKSTIGAFAISGALAGVAGGLIIVLQQGSGFEGLNPELSFTIFIGVVIGGLGSITGGILGAAFLGLTQYYLSGTIAIVIQGFVLILVLMFFPEGIGGIFTWIRNFIIRAIARYKHIDLNRIDELNSDVKKDNLKETFERGLAAKLEMSDAEVEIRKFTGVSQESKDFSRPILKLKGINASYSKLKILNEIGFEVPFGHIYGLLGTNGAGKSTVLRVVSGLMRSDSGEVVFDGEDITKLKTEELVRRGISMAPGGKGVFGSLTVKENLALATWLYQKDKEFIDAQYKKIFDLFPALESRMNLQARLLSGGERQMLTIAMNLFLKPRLLLIDELSLGLAPLVISHVVDALKKLVESGITVVIVEQSLNLATSLVDSCVYLERGVVTYSGIPDQLLRDDGIVRSVFLEKAIKTVGDESDPHIYKNNKIGLSDKSILTQPETVLSINGITKTYGGISAISDVNIDVHDGEIHGLIGANGAGKTTLLDICTGIIQPSYGHITYRGADITKLASYRRAEIGLGRVFQHAYLFPTLTVKETIYLAHERHISTKDVFAPMFRIPTYSKIEKLVKQSTDEIIDKFNLEDFSEALISELSTGTKRVVELACLFANRPSFVFLDEPSSGLAQKETEALGELILDIHKELGVSMLIIEHDIPMIARISNRLTCLDIGQVIAEGTPGEVLGDQNVIEAFLGTNEVAINRSN